MDYIKICGLKEIEHINLCVEGGATAIGFIYNVPSSPRNLQKDKLIELLEQVPKEIKTVITFKSKSLNGVKNVMTEIDADLFQVHCGFNIRELFTLPNEKKRKIIVALRVDELNKSSVIQEINNSFNQFYAFLLDNSEGHGALFNYDIVLEILRMTYGTNIIIAGGINVNNVQDYIQILKPYGIDVSSSIESEKGVKDPIKIKSFLEKIKEVEKN